MLFVTYCFLLSPFLSPSPYFLIPSLIPIPSPHPTLVFFSQPWQPSLPFDGMKNAPICHPKHVQIAWIVLKDSALLRAMHWVQCLCVSFLRPELWWFGAGPQWHHWKPGLPTWLSQLCQLHMDRDHGGAQPDPAVLPHIRAGGGLWHSFRVWWAAPARQPQSKVRSTQAHPSSSQMALVFSLKFQF